MDRISSYIIPHKDVHKVSSGIKSLRGLYLKYFQDRGISPDNYMTIDGMIIPLKVNVEEYVLPVDFKYFLEMSGTTFDISVKHRLPIMVTITNIVDNSIKRLDVYGQGKICVLNGVRLPSLSFSESGFYCNSCSKNIPFNYPIYHCLKCIDSCLCERCFKKGNTFDDHVKGHKMLSGYNYAYNRPCDNCNSSLNLREWWFMPKSEYNLCENCYETSDKKTRMKNLFREDVPPYFNTYGSLLDWVPFSECNEKQSEFFINCNAQSPFFGQIAQSWKDDCGFISYDITSVDTKEFLLLINEWIKLKETDDLTEEDKRCNFGLWLRYKIHRGTNFVLE